MAEETDGGSRIHFGCDLDAMPSVGQPDLKWNAILIILVTARFGEGEFFQALKCQCAESSVMIKVP